MGHYCYSCGEKLIGGIVPTTCFEFWEILFRDKGNYNKVAKIEVFNNFAIISYNTKDETILNFLDQTLKEIDIKKEKYKETETSDAYGTKIYFDNFVNDFLDKIHNIPDEFFLEKLKLDIDTYFCVDNRFGGSCVECYCTQCWNNFFEPKYKKIENIVYIKNTLPKPFRDEYESPEIWDEFIKIEKDIFELSNETPKCPKCGKNFDKEEIEDY